MMHRMQSLYESHAMEIYVRTNLKHELGNLLLLGNTS